MQLADWKAASTLALIGFFNILIPLFEGFLSITVDVKSFPIAFLNDIGAFMSIRLLIL